MRKLMVALALALCGAQAFAQANTGVIEGRIFNAVTQEPLANVQITLIAPSLVTGLTPDAAAQLATQTAALIQSGIQAGASQNVIDTAVANLQRNSGGGGARGGQTAIVADSQGRFTIKDLAPGRYSVRVQREGYFGPPQNGNIPDQALKAVTVTAGAPALIDFPLTPGGIISGRVRDPNGQAVSGVQIAAYRLTYNNGRKLWTQASSKATDDRGEYRMFWLPPGEYYVGALPRVPGTVPGPQDSWARTFFPGVTEPEAASLVSLKKGGESSGIDINIRSASTSLFKISGIAKNPYARPNPNGTVDQSVSSFYLVPRELGVLEISATSVQNMLPVNARANGEFEIRNVRPGSYDLVPYFSEPVPVGTTTASPPQSRFRFSRNPLEVRSADVTGLSLSLAAGLELPGEIVVTGTSVESIRKQVVRLNLRPVTGISLPMASAVATPDASGRFLVTNLPPDRYTVNAAVLPEGVFVADIRQGAATVFDTGFVVDGNANPVQVVLDTGGVQVNGVVRNAERLPVSNATVALVPPAARRQNALLYRNASTDESGRFTLLSVPPGAYTLYAWENVPAMAWLNAEFMSSYEGRGRPVVVAPQSPLQIEVGLIPSESVR